MSLRKVINGGNTGYFEGKETWNLRTAGAYGPGLLVFCAQTTSSISKMIYLHARIKPQTIAMDCQASS